MLKEFEKQYGFAKAALPGESLTYKDFINTDPAKVSDLLQNQDAVLTTAQKHGLWHLWEVGQGMCHEILFKVIFLTTSIWHFGNYQRSSRKEIPTYSPTYWRRFARAPEEQ